MANRKPSSARLAAGGVVDCGSVGEMIALGEELAAELTGGAVLSLEGPLGAGKTHLAKGVARGLGFLGEVSSPTFTLVQEYVGGRLPVYHFDFYRLEALEDLVNLGFEDYLDGSGVVLIEWGDRFDGGALPGGAWRVRIAAVGLGRRVEWRGDS